MFKEPPAVVCYVCGRRFGTKSIGIHIPQCLKKFEAQEALKPKHERKPLPKPLDAPVGGGNMAAYNAMAEKRFQDEVMEACPNCGRTFLADRLQVHLRSCSSLKPSASSQAAKDRLKSVSPAPPSGSRLTTTLSPVRLSNKPKTPMLEPLGVVCYICGRKFGTTSIGIHTPQCAKKWEAQEALKPKHERKPLPKPIGGEASPGGAIAKGGLAAYNAAAEKRFQQDVLEACPNCGRTFLPDRLEVHLRSCRAVTPNNRRPSSAAASKTPTSSNRRGVSPRHRERVPMMPPAVVCHICGRQFGTTSIGIHVPQCIKKWEAQENLKPKGERRPVPTKPMDVPVGVSSISREEYNMKAMENFQKQGMVECPHCGRKFLEDRFSVHSRSCTADKPARRIQMTEPSSPAASSLSKPTGGCVGMIGPAMQWGVADVVEFFKGLSFSDSITENAIKEINESDIDGETLLGLKEEDLVEGLGLSKLHARKALSALAVRSIAAAG